MSYRNDVDALAARVTALDAEVAEATQRRDEAKALLEEARRPLLPNLRIASPCPVAWSEMTGDDRVRACTKCQQNVYNVSDMTRAEVQALIDSRTGRMCVRYFQRQDGTILLADCEIGRKGKTKRRLVAAGIAGLVAAGIGGAVASRAKAEDVQALAGMLPTNVHEIAGGLAEPMPEDRMQMLGVTAEEPASPEPAEPPAAPVPLKL